MPRFAIRTVLVTLAVLLGLGAGGAALAAATRAPGSTDLGPSISVTQTGSPAPAGSPHPAASEPPSPSPASTPRVSPSSSARPPEEGNKPVPVQPAPPQDYDDDDEWDDDWDDDGGDDD
ncbi:MAG: hypothetical protein ACQEXN_03695 [Actinomycetota bacterium]